MIRNLRGKLTSIIQIPKEQLGELKVSNGVLRYCTDEEGKLLGLHLADASLKDNDLADLLAGNDSSKLQVLHIARNEITHLNLNLPALTFLDARENQSLTKVDLSGCPNLEKVVLNRCGISSLVLPKSMPNLVQLEVASNRLTELTLGGEISNLRFLDLSDNQLIQLPTVLANCKDDFYLLASGNQFDEITSGILLDETLSDEDRRERLKNFLSQFNDSDDAIDTLIMIFLGNTQAGKATLADLLTGDNKADQGSTHGVNLFEKKSRELRLSALILEAKTIIIVFIFHCLTSGPCIWCCGAMGRAMPLEK